MEFNTKQETNNKLVIFDMIGSLTTNPHLISQIFHLTFPSIDVGLVREYYQDYKIDKIDRKTFWNGIGFDRFTSQETRFLDNISLKQGVEEMLKMLKEEYKLALLSNIPKEWGHYLKNRYSFENIFDAIIFSGEHGVQKPDKEIYEVLLKHFEGGNFDKMYFVDDDLEDLKTAKEFSIQTILLGSGQYSQSFQPDYVIQDIFEIIDIVKE